MCLPCLLRRAIGSLSGHSAPPRKAQTKARGKTIKAQDPKSIAALAALNRQGKSPTKVQKKSTASKAKGGGRVNPVFGDPVVCVLCGQLVHAGTLLTHKAEVHGESRVTPSPVRSKGSNVWVNVFQGGLPGLGKRR